MSSKNVRLTRWSGGQHPTIASVTRLLKNEGLRPHMCANMANYRYAVRSHGYDKVLYVIDGSVEIILPDSNQRAQLRTGDRLDIPAGIRYGTIVGQSGAKCIEATPAPARALS